MSSAAILELVYELSADTATCFIVPLSFRIIWSASTIVTDEALVSPSIMFISAAVAVTAVLPKVSCPSGTIRPAAPLNIKSSAEVSQVTLALAVSPYKITS